MTEEYRIIETESGLEIQGDIEVESPTEYYAPMTLEEAESLKKKGKGYHYFAGGTILNWRGSPKVKGLLDLKHLDLGKIEVTSSKVVIGAMVTIQEIADHPNLPAPFTQAAKSFTSRNIRNMATIGGTATGNFFISDILPVLVAFHTEIEYFQNGSKKTTPIATWLKEKPGIICSIIIPHLNRKVKLQQEKIAKMDFPLIVTSIGFEITDKMIKDPVVAISGATGKLIISESGAAYLSGKQLSGIDFEILNTAVQNDVQPTGSIKATPHVKQRIIESHLKTMVAEFKKEEK